MTPAATDPVSLAMRDLAAAAELFGAASDDERGEALDAVFAAARHARELVLAAREADPHAADPERPEHWFSRASEASVSLVVASVLDDRHDADQLALAMASHAARAATLVYLMATPPKGSA